MGPINSITVGCVSPVTTLSARKPDGTTCAEAAEVRSERVASVSGLFIWFSVKLRSGLVRGSLANPWCVYHFVRIDSGNFEG